MRASSNTGAVVLREKVPPEESLQRNGLHVTKDLDNMEHGESGHSDEAEVQLRVATKHQQTHYDSDMIVQLSSSISDRPRLPTPTPDKLGISETHSSRMLSPTPVTEVRTSAWYDNLTAFLRPRSTHEHPKVIDEESGHYVNDGLQ